MNIEITKDELNALITLLQRVDLKGAEVPTYNKIINVLSAPIIKEKVKE